MKTFSHFIIFLILIFSTIVFSATTKKSPLNPIANRTRPHLDHSAYFKKDIKTPPRSNNSMS